MLTIETKEPKKNQTQRGRILNLTPERAGSSSVAAIRRLPSAYAMMHNISIKEALLQPALFRQETNTDIYVKVNGVYKRIRTRDIYLVEGLCDYVNIYTKERRYTIYSTMYGILEKLPKGDFARVHRSFIVRLDAISSIENDRLSVEMRKIPIGRTFKNGFMSKLKVIMPDAQ